MQVFTLESRKSERIFIYSVLLFGFGCLLIAFLHPLFLLTQSNISLKSLFTDANIYSRPSNQFFYTYRPSHQISQTDLSYFSRSQVQIYQLQDSDVESLPYSTITSKTSMPVTNQPFQFPEKTRFSKPRPIESSATSEPENPEVPQPPPPPKPTVTEPVKIADGYVIPFKDKTALLVLNQDSVPISGWGVCSSDCQFRFECQNKSIPDREQTFTRGQTIAISLNNIQKDKKHLCIATVVEKNVTLKKSILISFDMSQFNSLIKEGWDVQFL